MPLDNPTQREGDSGFIGMASRLNPLQLKEGMVQLAVNMRLDRGVAQTRKGAKRLADAIAAGETELVLDFTLGNEVTGPIVRSTYSGGVFAAGIYSSPRLDDSNEYIVLAAPDAAYLWREGASLVTKSYPTSPAAELVLPGDDVSILQAFDRLYLLRWRDEPEYRLSSLTQTSGTATATTPTAHGYTAGQVVRIYGSDQAGYNADFLIASVPTTPAIGGQPTTFTFALPSGTVTPSTGVAFARRVCPALVWDGGAGNFARVGLGTHPAGPTFSRMPSASIVTYTNNQLLLARNRDEVLISDVLDAETYDPLLKSFRANAGSNDQIVALHPYAEGQVLVFCRKSIWLATAVMKPDGISIDEVNSSLQLLTSEIGCCARRSIATAGIYVYFLSDSGVYRLDNQFDLKLRGNTKPLSDPIADLLSEINVPAVGLSNGVFFNNRYWLAVPTRLANGIPSDAPNTLFIYNMLNEAWESRDSYPFNLDQLIVSDYGTERRLYASSRNGKLYLLDQYESGLDDQPTGSGTYTVEGQLVTRRYGFGSLTGKRLTRSISSVLLPAGAAASMDAVTTDPDADFQILGLTNNGISLEDYTVKGPIRRNANLLDLRWRTTAGRPILRAITAEATVDGLPKTGTRTEE